jgi:valyl-tRNA synthetase
VKHCFEPRSGPVPQTEVKCRKQGNVVDPLGSPKFGADSLRYSLVFGVPGGDIPAEWKNLQK